MSTHIVEKIVEKLERMPPELQERVLRFAESLSADNGRGVSGRDPVKFAGTIEQRDLQAMSQAIEEACEQVDRNEW